MTTNDRKRHPLANDNIKLIESMFALMGLGEKYQTASRGEDIRACVRAAQGPVGAWTSEIMRVRSIRAERAVKNKPPASVRKWLRTEWIKRNVRTLKDNFRYLKRGAGALDFIVQEAVSVSVDTDKAYGKSPCRSYKYAVYDHSIMVSMPRTYQIVYFDGRVIIESSISKSAPRYIVSRGKGISLKVSSI